MEKFSNDAFDGADPKIVMAELSAQDVVNQARSDRDCPPSDVIASQTEHSQVSVEEERAITTDSQSNEPSAGSLHVNGIEGEFVGDNKKNTTSTRSNGESFPEPSNIEGKTEEQQLQPNGDVSLQPGSDYLSGPVTSADVSGGSDSDTTKPDGENSSSKKSTGEKGHSRSQSVKKPASFKAVSVTKNFLAKATTGVTPISKLTSDKATPTAGQLSTSAQLAASRPRLVAKTVNGMRDVTPRSGSNGSGNGRGSGPDPNQVWNKNRPVQPPPPKQFTDEELKQTYGIHLATRLQADEAGKEAKWADIDDDDDDWAPDTIEWNDGTKITLPQHEEQALLSEEEAPAMASQEKSTDAASPVPSQAESISASTSAITGSKSAVSSNQPKSGGLVLKGAAEKPTLVSKPQGPPMPVKSPWAPLPPLDKAAPSPISLQQPQVLHMQGSSRFQRDPQGFDSTAAPVQAKEIAADDFNRSWRDNQPGSSRELFNSHSGRYEPVGDGRRGPARFEQNFRQPSVLQRPVEHNQQGPAEPSAAFQTNRASGHTEGGWGRRRTSSTVSGGSGGFGRRMSFGKGQDMQPPILHDAHQAGRRGSNAGVNMEPPASPRNLSPSRSSHHARASPAQSHYPPRDYSPVQPSHHQQWQSRASPGVDHAHVVAPYSTGTPQGGPHPQQQQQYATPGKNQELSMLPGNELEDPLALQAKIMQESRELAKRRKKEQQEKEEAELKERIKLKLEALGAPQVAEKDDSKSTNEAASKENKLSTHNQNAPKSFVSEASGEVRQYGLMKVHPTEPFKKPAQVNQLPANKESERQSLGPQSASPTSSSNVSGTGSRDMRFGNGSVPQPQEPTTQGAPQSPPSDRKDQPWKNVPTGSDKYTSWGGAGMTTHSTPGGNLWGPPSNDKALGNGTFDRGFGRFPPRSSAQQQFPPPGPIGPPGGSLRSTSVDPSPQYAGTASNNIREDSRPAGGMSPPESRPIKPANQVSAAPSPKPVNGPGPISRPGPIAPPSGPGMSRQNRAQAVSAWNNLPTQLAQQDAEAREKRSKEYARLEEEVKLGIKQDEPPRVTYKDTWRQVTEGPPGARHVVSVSTVVAESAPLPANQEELQRNRQMAHATATPETANSASHLNASGNNRGSRFFPPMGDTVLGRSTSQNPEYSSPPSPPPPIAHDHPAYDGDAERPQVALPPMSEATPKIIVKLPPPVIAPPPSAGSAPRREATRLSPRVSDRNTVAELQARIAELVGSKQPLPTKTNDLAINSATKAPLELPLVQTSATVSLPRSEDEDLTSAAKMFLEDNGDVTSRATEEALLEEREFGSLPVVRLPLRPPPGVWPPALAPPTARHKSKFQKLVQVASKDPLSFSPKDYQLKQGYFIPLRLPGSSEMKPVLKTRQEGSPQTSSPHPPQRSPTYAKRKNKPSRESSGNVGSGRVASLVMQPGQQRPGFHSGTWNRRVSEAVQ